MTIAEQLQALHDAVGFDTKHHSYQVDGKTMDPVTSIVESTLAKGWDYLGWVGQCALDGGHKNHYRAVMKAEAAKGKYVHRIMENWALRRLGLPELLIEPNPEGAYLAAGLPEFMDAIGLEPVAPPERRLYHPTLGYAGTLDLAARWHECDVVVDIKTCKIASDRWDSWNLQNAGYRLALREHGVTPGAQGLIVRVPKDGAAPNILILGDDPADFEAFRSLLDVYRWQRRAQSKAPRKGVVAAVEKFMAREG